MQSNCHPFHVFRYHLHPVTCSEMRILLFLVLCSCFPSLSMPSLAMCVSSGTSLYLFVYLYNSPR
ncbi:hypothetical protein Hanom_Chr15g01411361 [Helianthus anomalus]